jgi:hypothetical protein
MATGIIGTLSGSGNITYTPTTNAKVIVNYTNTSGTSMGAGFAINSISSMALFNNNSSQSLTLFVAAGVLVTFSGIAGGQMIISALES